MGFVAHDLGVDLGTSNTLVYVRHKGIVINEPTIVVVDAANERRVRAVGDDAKVMLGRTTDGVMKIAISMLISVTSMVIISQQHFLYNPAIFIPINAKNFPLFPLQLSHKGKNKGKYISFH